MPSACAPTERCERGRLHALSADRPQNDQQRQGHQRGGEIVIGAGDGEPGIGTHRLGKDACGQQRTGNHCHCIDAGNRALEQPLLIVRHILGDQRRQARSGAAPAQNVKQNARIDHPTLGQKRQTGKGNH